MAVQTIKSLSKRRWLDDDSPHFSWYEPLTDPDALARSVRWVLGRSDVFLNSSSDAHLLAMTLRAASDAGPVPTDVEMQADVDAHQIEPLFDGDRLERI